MFSSNRWRFALRLAATAVFLLPLYWMVSAALHPPGAPLPQSWRLLPEQISWQNFSRIWELVPLRLYLRNSVGVVALAIPLTLITSSWAAYSMSQLPRRSQQRWVLISLMVLMVPGIALWTTRFLIYKQLGWLDSVWALIAPAWMGTSPFYVLMFYRAFRRIPAALYEAARLDGAGVLQTWRLVAFPLARPTAVGVALLSFAVYWGDYLTPLLYVSEENLYTLPVALELLQQMSRSDWPLLMAAAAFTTLIPTLLFIAVQPIFIKKG